MTPLDTNLMVAWHFLLLFCAFTKENMPMRGFNLQHGRTGIETGHISAGLTGPYSRREWWHFLSRFRTQSSCTSCIFFVCLEEVLLHAGCGLLWPFCTLILCDLAVSAGLKMNTWDEAVPKVQENAMAESLGCLHLVYQQRPVSTPVDGRLMTSGELSECQTYRGNVMWASSLSADSSMDRDPTVRIRLAISEL